MSSARDHDWFCEGIAEEILNALTKLPSLRVATRTSAFRFKDPARDLRKIGETLGVTTLLEGSVRTAGSRLRVTAHLVNASDGYQLWSERFDRQMEDIFEIQDEIAKQVMEALKLRLAELERRAATEYVSPIALALALSELGDQEKARTLLGEALAERASMLVLINLPCFRKLRGELLMEDFRRRLLGERGEGATR